MKRIWGGDYPLTDKGVSDVADLKERLAFIPDVVISSPLKRAQQTAKILFPDMKIITDDVFREINFGNHENKAMLKDECLKIYQTKPSILHKFSQGDVIKERADKAILVLLDYSSAKNVAVICHDTLIRAIICRLKGESLDNMPKYKELISNCSIVKINLPIEVSVIQI